MKHDIDWSKSHNGVMLCDFHETIRLMPEVKLILHEVGPILEMNWQDYLIDVKIHMLMPDQYPCIPNWHNDFLPRNSEGEREKGKQSDKKMYMWISGDPLTEYIDEHGAIYTKEAQKWHSFTQSDTHRGALCREHTWRCFIRIIPKEFVHESTINVGQLRRHTQVYLDSNKFKW